MKNDRRWWTVEEIPPTDYGATRFTPGFLGYHYGSKHEVEAWGARDPRHDTWGTITVTPLYLEDVMRELIRLEAERDTINGRISDLTTIQAEIRFRMGL